MASARTRKDGSALGVAARRVRKLHSTGLVRSRDGRQVIESLARSFADERSGLERQWEQGEDIETEDLRIALQRYRSFFHRLLAT